MVLRRAWSTFLRLVPPPRVLAVVLATAVVVGTWIYGSQDGRGIGLVRVRQPGRSLAHWTIDSAATVGVRRSLARWSVDVRPAGLHTDNGPHGARAHLCAGVALLMALAKTIAGHCAVFAVVPIAAGMLVLATYGLGVRLGSPWGGVAAAWLVATSPTVLMMAMAPMSDVPESAAWAATFYFMLAQRGDRPSPQALPPASQPSFDSISHRSSRSQRPGTWSARWWPGRRNGSARWRLAAAFFGGVAPCAIGVGTIAQHFYGSPFRTGYGRIESDVRLGIRLAEPRELQRLALRDPDSRCLYSGWLPS